MTRCQLEDSIWKLIPYFFPEMPKQETNSYVFVDARSNSLLVSIKFYTQEVDSAFDANLNKFNRFLKTSGIYPVPEEIMKHHWDKEKQEKTYYYQIPLSIAQGFTD